MVQTFGYAREEVIGRTSTELGIWIDPADRRRAVAALKQHGVLQGLEITHRTKSGEVRHFVLSLSVLQSNGAPYLFVMGNDITARKQAEDMQARLMAELQRVNTELQQFAYIVSHDLNEPLRTMRNYVQLLARRAQGKLEGSAAEYMVFITDAAQRMQQMLTDLLAYTRAGQTPELHDVDCEAVLTQVLTALQTQITERGAVITHDHLPTVRSDATRLHQVLQNLIGNALKFCEATPPRIHIAAIREEGRWRFAVQDNGIGIDPQQAERIFQIFQRLHTRSKYPGTGIGLAICKRIVEQHGGRIWVESQPGEGAIFYFTVSDIGGAEPFGSEHPA
jgi:PAS domain S-box-containing protein